jgi:hypothetical protein
MSEATIGRTTVHGFEALSNAPVRTVVIALTEAESGCG